MKPVFVVSGFLESGKTTFIEQALKSRDYPYSLRTLLLACEEGEVEYDEKLLGERNVVKLDISNEQLLSEFFLNMFDQSHIPGQIFIEMNGMWDPGKLTFPGEWELDQSVLLIDASTFPLYYTNMRTQLSTLIRGCETVIFNRCDGISEENLIKYKRNVKAINTKAQFVFRTSIKALRITEEESLPYSLDDQLLDIRDNLDFGIWFLDAVDHPSRYYGKQITFLAEVRRQPDYPENFFKPGRTFMTCCANDMQFLGFPCRFSELDAYADGDWIEITADVREERFQRYGKEELILTAVNVRKIDEPKRPLIQFAI